MTAKLTPQARLLALVGIVLVATLAVVMVMRSSLLSSDETEATSVVAVAKPARPATTARNAATAPSQSKLLPGVPAPVANRLRYSRVVVVGLFARRSADDRTQMAQARAGARSVGAGFVAIDVINERNARSVAAFADDASDAKLLIVKRPGKVANHFDAYVDQRVVAQAAVNAGARLSK